MGPNEAGKTAVIRALRFLCLNKLAGSPDDYIRHGKPKMAVRLKLDGHWVSRIKGRGKKGTNHYVLDNKILRTPGRSTKTIPNDVANLLNIDASNFQRQFDLPFWFSDTAGQVSKQLNEIVNLAIIDATMAHVSTRVRKARLGIEVCQERLESSREKCEKLSWVPRFVRDAKRLERLSARHQRLAEEAGDLASLCGGLGSARQQRKMAGRVLRGAKKALLLGTRAARLHGECKELETCIREAEDAWKQVEQAVPDISRLLRVRAEADAVAEDCGELEHLILDLEKEKREICQLEKLLSVTEKDLRKRSRRSNVCPTCGQKLPASGSATSTSGTRRRSVDLPKETGGRR